MGVLSVLSHFVVCLGMISLFFSQVFADNSLKENSNEIIFNRLFFAPKMLFVPGMHSYGAEKEVIEDFSEGLVKYDSSGEIVPAAAERWEVSKDGLRWTFFIRKNARYSDGTQVTAFDFVNTLKRNFKQSAENESLKKNLISLCTKSTKIKNALNILDKKCSIDGLGVKALNSQTLEIELEKPQNKKFFLLAIGAPAAWVPTKPELEFSLLNLEAPKHKFSYPSNGPFFISSIKFGECVELKKNPYYWDSKNVHLDGVIYHVINKDEQQVNQWCNGELDYFSTMHKNQRDTISILQPQSKWNALCGGIYAYFTINKNSLLYGARDLREAFALILDRDYLKQVCYASSEESYYGLISPYYGDFDRAEPRWSLKTLEERYIEAQDILRKFGYSETNPLILKVISYINITEFTQMEKYFSEISEHIPEIQFAVQRLESSDVVRRIEADVDNSFDLALGAKSTTAPRPFSIFKAAGITANSSNVCHCKNIQECAQDCVEKLKNDSLMRLKEKSTDLKNFFKKIGTKNSEGDEYCFPWCEKYFGQEKFYELLFKEDREIINGLFEEQSKMYQTYVSTEHDRKESFLDEYNLILSRIVADLNLTSDEESALYTRLDQIITEEWPVIPLCSSPMFSIKKDDVEGIEASERDFTGRFPSSAISINRK